MSVHPTEERLNDYVDGQLPPLEAEETARHLEECPACRAEVQGLRELLRRVAELPREVSPPAEVWQEVRGDTVDLPARRRGALWGMRHGLAAAAVVLVALSSALTAVLVRGGEGGVPTMAPVAVTPETATNATMVELRRAEADYVRTVEELEAVLAERRGALAPETVTVLEENLRIIDAAIRDASAALARDPASAELPNVLASTYQAKIDVLERTLRLSAQT